jgi:hypothetical protein
MPEEPPQNQQQVVVTDIHMPFWSMVVFMVKWAIAAIPALLILFVASSLAWATIFGLIVSMLTGKGREATPSRGTPTSSSSPLEHETSASPSAAPADETAAYLSKVTVRGVEVSKTSLGGRGIFGEVKNTGDRTLSKVEITVFCLDKDGTRVFEKTYLPVLVTHFSLGGDNTPLKPGYSRKFGYKLDEAPSEWSGKVEVEVTRVEFSDKTAN